jgi:dTMP kinase
MFIVLEGVDGCGKSTHARLLAEWLREKGRKARLTAEPTEGRIGSLIREILSGKVEVDPRTLALLFTADRMEHLAEIRAAQAEGADIISDRYYYSTVAYQAAQGVDRQWLLTLNGFVIKPDLVILLDIGSEAAEGRARSGEIFERKEFLEKVRTEYKKFRTLKTVDSARPQEEVQEEIRGIVQAKMGPQT